MWARQLLDASERALRLWGWRAQRMMFIEECGEAMQAISKCERGIGTEDAVLEELVDVHIALYSLIDVYGNSKEFGKVMKRKLDRLEGKLDDLE